MNGHPQGASIAPMVMEPEQCTGCPPGNSLPLLYGESVCWDHSYMNADNGASSCIDYDD